MVAKVGVSLIRQLVKQLRNISEVVKEKPVGERASDKELYTDTLLSIRRESPDFDNVLEEEKKKAGRALEPDEISKIFEEKKDNLEFRNQPEIYKNKRNLEKELGRRLTNEETNELFEDPKFKSLKRSKEPSFEEKRDKHYIETQKKEPPPSLSSDDPKTRRRNIRLVDIQGKASQQKKGITFYSTLLTRLRNQVKRGEAVEARDVPFEDLPIGSQAILKDSGKAGPGDMVTLPSTMEQGKRANKAFKGRSEALREQESRDLNEKVPKGLEKIPVIERLRSFDYETYDPQIGPTRREDFEDQYIVTNPYEANYGLTRDDPPGTQFVTRPLKRTDPETGETKILSPREARIEDLKNEIEEIKKPTWLSGIKYFTSNETSDGKKLLKKVKLLERTLKYYKTKNLSKKEIEKQTQAKDELEKIRKENSKKAKTRLRKVNNQLKYQELTRERYKIKNQMVNDIKKEYNISDKDKKGRHIDIISGEIKSYYNPELNKILNDKSNPIVQKYARQLDDINEKLEPKDSDWLNDSQKKDTTRLTTSAQLQEDKKSVIYVDKKYLGRPRGLSSVEPLAKQSDPIVDEDGFTIGKFTKQGKEKFNLERAGTGASDAEKQLAIVTNLIEISRGTNKPIRMGKFVPRNYLRELDKYKDTSEPVENIFEGIGRVRRENNYINQLLKDEEKVKGRPLMPDEIEEQFPRIYNEYIKPVAKELEQEEQLKKQLRESAGGTGEAIGKETGYTPYQVSAFMRGQKDIPSDEGSESLIDVRPEKIDLDEIYEGKQIEIDPDPEVEGMPQRRSTDEFTQRLYDDTAATTKLNPEAALIQREDIILDQIKRKLAKEQVELEKKHGKTTSGIVATERELDEIKENLLERGLAAIRPKRDVRGAAEQFFKKPKKQSKKKPASKKLTPAEKNKRIKSVNKRIKTLTPLIEKNGPEKYKKRIDSINKDIVELGIERKALKGSKKQVESLEEDLKKLYKKNTKNLPVIEKKLKGLKKDLEKIYKKPVFAKQVKGKTDKEKKVIRNTTQQKIETKLDDKRKDLLQTKKINSTKKKIKKLKSYNDPPRYEGEFGSNRHPVFKRKGGSIRGHGAALRGF